MMWTTQKIISDIGIGFFSIIISFNYCFFLKQMFLSMIESIDKPLYVLQR